MRTDPNRATDVLRTCGLTGLSVIEVRPLDGGMINHVEEWLTDGEPRSVVCKVGYRDQHDRLARDMGLCREARVLRWMRQHSQLPVPDVYGMVQSSLTDRNAYLVIETLPGRSLDGVRLTPAGTEALSAELAMHLRHLHRIRGTGYGSPVDGESFGTWLEWFEPRLQANYEDTAARLSTSARRTVESLLAELARWLPEAHDPRLVHGDIWQGNVLVADADSDSPRITGFVDGGGLFADVEYELAFMQVFGMVGESFLRRYEEWHPLRPGHEQRRHIYWLNSMLIHLWLFGDRYLERCERVAEEVAAFVGRG